MNQENLLGDKTEGFSPFKFFVIFFMFLILLNLIYIDFLTLKGPKLDVVPTPRPIQKTALKENDICPQSCISQIQTPTPTQALQQSKPVRPANEVTYKDYYINLGSGSNRSTEWTDVAGTVNTFDISDYKNIKEARLETNTNAPTANGTISIRLFNKTDGSAVWNSERTVQAEKEGSLLISEPLNYPYGPKMYQIQMKSQLGVEANLIQARIHIITN